MRKVYVRLSELTNPFFSKRDCLIALAVVLALIVPATVAHAMTLTVTVTKTGSGSGTVTSTGGLGTINCGAICSDTFNNGDVVTLTATASTGSAFVGWTGDCSGVNPSDVWADVNQTLSVDRSCTATFEIAIDFETLPNGSTPTEVNSDTLLTSPYVLGATTVTFGNDTNNDLVIELFVRLENYNVSNGTQNGFVATTCGGGPHDCDGGGRTFFVRNSDEDGVNMQAGDDFLIIYGGVLPTSLSFQLWDPDGILSIQEERYTATLFDLAGVQIGAPKTIGPFSNLTFDGRPEIIAFSTVDTGGTPVKTIRVEGFNPPGGALGLAFDNFVATGGVVTAVPEPPITGGDPPIWGNLETVNDFV